MPFPGFLHSMNTILQTTIIDSVFDEGRRPLPNQDARAQDCLTSEYVVPGPIYEYCSNNSTAMTPGNQEVKVNMPEITLPQPSNEKGEDIITSGTYGPVNADTHNVYETNLCP